MSSEKTAWEHAVFPLETTARPIVTFRNADRTLVTRRTVLFSVGTLLAAASACRPGFAQGAATGRAADALSEPAPLVPTAQFGEAFAKVVGTGTPVEGQMTLEMPEDAENGNIVPYKISVESPMTEDDHIARVHLLSTQNPQPLVATFHFTPLSGKAVVSGRMRLARTQEVVAVALTSAGTLRIARTTVEVGIGGCGAE